MASYREPRRKVEPRRPGREAAYLLDRFTQRDLRTWLRVGDKTNRYWIGLYYHLEAQRQLHRRELIEALGTTKPGDIQEDTWFRIVDYEHSLSPLSLVGSTKVGGRFNIGRDLDPAKFPIFPALYAGSDYDTAYAEKFGAPNSTDCELAPHQLALRTPESFAAVRLRINVTGLFDLRYVGNLQAFCAVIRRFKLSAELKLLARELGKKPPFLIQGPEDLQSALMASDWRAFPVQLGIPANSQIFARLLVEAGFTGVIYPSTKGTGLCVAIFPQNFPDSGTAVELIDPSPGHLRHRILNTDSFEELATE